MKNPDSFRSRLKKMRQRLGLTQEEMARDIGMTRTGYADIEHGAAGKSFMKLPAIARELGCRIDDLFPEMDQPKAGMRSEAEATEAKKSKERLRLCCGRKHVKERTPEILAAHDALGAAKTWFNAWGFIAPCPLCGRKNSAVEVRQDYEGTVTCHCKRCGADKAAIYRAVDMERWLGGHQTETQTKRKEQSEMCLRNKRFLSMDEIYGVNKCTTCVHYHVLYFGDDAFYGCKERNQYMSGAVWNRPGDDPLHPCKDYCADMAMLQNAKDRLNGAIDEIAKEMYGYRMRLDLLQEIERTCGSAHQADTDGQQAEEQP